MTYMIKEFIFNELFPNTKNNLFNSFTSETISDEDFKSCSTNTTLDENLKRSKSQENKNYFVVQRKNKKNKKYNYINEKKELNKINNYENIYKINISSIENESCALGDNSKFNSSLR